jgi:uncharacterized repeat protein (TIGR02543 family)
MTMNLEATTTQVAGGTQVEIVAYGFTSSTNAFTSFGTGTKSWSAPGARSDSPTGPAAASSGGNNPWSYNIAGKSKTVSIYGGFLRYFPTGAASVTITVTATGNSPANSLASQSVSLTVPLYTATTFMATYYANNATSGSTGATSYTNPPSTSGTVANNGFTRTGYYFTGWNTAANGTGTWYYGGDSFTGNINLYAQWQANTYTIEYNSSNGSVSGSGSTSSSQVSYSSTSITTRANGFTAPSGYAFGGWSTSQDNTADYAAGTGPSGFDLSSSSTAVTYYAVWVQTDPVFSNSGITTTGTLGRNINTNADFTVAASPVTGYSIVYSGTGLNPTSWLSINSAGQLSGIPPAIGTYTFKIRATYNSYNTDTAEISFVVSPPGFRMTGSSTRTRLASAKRFIGIGQSTTNFQGQTIAADAEGYVSLSKMAIYKAGIWTDISNVS